MSVYQHWLLSFKIIFNYLIIILLITNLRWFYQMKQVR